MYLSEAYNSELYQTVFISGSAGFFGGILNCAVQRKFAEITKDRAFNYIKIGIDYVSSGLFFGFGSAAITYLYFISYPKWSTETIEVINKTSILLAILSPTMLTIIIELFNKNIFRQD